MTDTYAPTDNGRKARTPAPTKVLVELVAHDGDNAFVAINPTGKRVIVTLTDDETGMAIKALAQFIGRPTAARFFVGASVTPDQVEPY